MDINIVRLLFDAGLFVLIWMIQLLIYPSFQYLSAENLIKWHRIYTFRLSLIVIPLMFGQLIIAAFQLYKNITNYHFISLIMVVLVWLFTFTIFVPIHNRIANNIKRSSDLKQLVNRNWIRTALWTLIFGYSAINFLS